MEAKNLLKLKQYFREQGLTQEKAAARLGQSAMAVNILLNGKRNFGVKSAMDWSREFGLNPMWLMTGEGEMLLGKPPIPDNVVLVPHINLDARQGFAYNEEMDVQQYTIDMIPFSANVENAITSLKRPKTRTFARIGGKKSNKSVTNPRFFINFATNFKNKGKWQRKMLRHWTRSLLTGAISTGTQSRA